jgi:RNA polymerase sigma factor (sigma-70 family)
MDHDQAGTHHEPAADDARSVTEDAELVARSRAGEVAAFAELWRRHYRAGITVARSLTSSLDADDLVQEAFTRIYQSIACGRGPTGSFRAYLFATIRNTAAAWGRARHETTLDELEAVPDPSTGLEASEATLDRTLTHQAFRSLPARWQEVLWYSEIERMKPAQIAPLLGMKATAVAQLTFRAREGLREAWIQAHLRAVDEDGECRWAIERLGAYSRRNLGRRDRARLDQHLAACAHCTPVAAEAREVSSRLAIVLLPLLAGAGTAASLAAAPGAAPTAVAAAPPVAVPGAVAFAPGGAAGGAVGGTAGTAVGGLAAGTGAVGAGGLSAAGAGAGLAAASAAGAAGGSAFAAIGAASGLAAASLVVVAGVVTAAAVPAGPLTVPAPAPSVAAGDAPAPLTSLGDQEPSGPASHGPHPADIPTASERDGAGHVPGPPAAGEGFTGAAGAGGGAGSGDGVANENSRAANGSAGGGSDGVNGSLGAGTRAGGVGTAARDVRPGHGKTAADTGAAADGAAEASARRGTGRPERSTGGSTGSPPSPGSARSDTADTDSGAANGRAPGENGNAGGQSSNGRDPRENAGPHAGSNPDGGGKNSNAAPNPSAAANADAGGKNPNAAQNAGAGGRNDRAAEPPVASAPSEGPADTAP